MSCKEGESAPTSDPGDNNTEAMAEFLKNIPKVGQLKDRSVIKLIYDIIQSSIADTITRFGNTFHFGNAGDYWHQAFPIGADNDFKSHAKQIREMEIRDDDILICSYPKTGLHWHTDIVRMLMNKTSEQQNDMDSMRGFIDARPIGVINCMKSPRVLVTHVPFRHIPRQALEKKIKIIYLDRNPKDVLVSYYSHVNKHVAPLSYTGTFEQFFYLCMEVGYVYGDLFDYLMEWQNGREANTNVDIFYSVFEDMKSDTVAGVKKLNTYLGTGCSDELCQQIANAVSFDKMKKFKDENSPARLNAMFVDHKMPLYRKGDVGDWTNWFTVTMNEEFDREYNKRVANYKTVYKYTL